MHALSHNQCSRSTANARQLAAPAFSAHTPHCAPYQHQPGYEMVARKQVAMLPQPRMYSQHNDGAGVSSTSTSGRSTVLELLRSGQNTYTNTPEMAAAVEQMIQEKPLSDPSSLVNAGLAQGTWKVFSAPHIATMSSFLFGVQFEPIYYRIEPNNSIASNVRFHHPVLGTGWLSAAGTLSMKYDNEVMITFERFWCDLGNDKLRPDIVPAGSTEGSGYISTDFDSVIGAMGRALFIQHLSSFPIHYLDKDLVVFEFKPLSSKISAQRLDS